MVTRINFTGAHKDEFRGIAPTGKSVTVAVILISKIVNGKIVESWEESDALGWMQQLVLSLCQEKSNESDLITIDGEIDRFN